MALSDEDYGILYNAITQQPMVGAIEIMILCPYWEGETLYPINAQQVRDFASFIILSEGRELP